MRGFVAVELSDAMKRPLVRILREELPRAKGVRWCTVEQLHVTLKFLGDVEDRVVPEVCRVLDEVSGELTPFSLRLGGIGCFPQARNPRVLWCGVEDEGRCCADWVERADPRLEALGFPAETRSFTPHITLGRSKSREGSAVMREILETLAGPPAESMEVEEITLFESLLLPRGAVYRPVHKAKLGAKS